MTASGQSRVQVLPGDHFVDHELLYQNPLAAESDVAQFRMEGPGVVTFPLERMRLESAADADEGQRANLVYWLLRDFPDDIAVSWEFWPIREPGLCMLFFAATGRSGEDLFDGAPSPRSGSYAEYHHGDINAYHVSYFRRRVERALHTCNLRKSYGFHLVAQGADPLPSVSDAKPPYRLRLVAFRGQIQFSVNEITSFQWVDDGSVGGPRLGAGKIGFRQMAPLIAEYANLRVHRVAISE